MTRVGKDVSKRLDIVFDRVRSELRHELSLLLSCVHALLLYIMQPLSKFGLEKERMKQVWRWLREER